MSHDPTSPSEAAITLRIEVSADGPKGERRESLTLRSLATQDDYEQCEALERSTWGDGIVVPASLLMVSQKVGGVTAGAFDPDGRLVAMVYGLTGPREGKLVHWSHMLAVAETLRGRGVGRHLKLLQRRLARDRGAETMLWTYDPLVARNAHLNINRLGARPVDYLEELYGRESDSHLHRGLGTDRFVVEWPMEGEPWRPMVERGTWEEAPIVNTTAEGEPIRGRLDLPGDVRVRVEIPFDIQLTKAAEPEAGARWRGCTRAAIQGYFGRGYEVAGFRRVPETDRCFYLLRDRTREGEAP